MYLFIFLNSCTCRELKVSWYWLTSSIATSDECDFGRYFCFWISRPWEIFIVECDGWTTSSLGFTTTIKWDGRLVYIEDSAKLIQRNDNVALVISMTKPFVDDSSIPQFKPEAEVFKGCPLKTVLFHVHIKTGLEIDITRHQYPIKHIIIDSVSCCFNTHYCIHFCSEVLMFVLVVSWIDLIDLNVGLECNA